MIEIRRHRALAVVLGVAALVLAVVTLRPSDDRDRSVTPGDTNGSPGTTVSGGTASPDTAAGPKGTDPTAPVGATPPPATGAVGYVGCSLSRGAVEGYGEVGGTRFWPAAQDYSGGTVERWAKNLTDSSKYWETFDAMNRAAPSTVIWWQLCTFSDSSDATNYTDALLVLGEIGRRIPGATVFVSAENGWEPPHVCDLTGPDGRERMQALAARLAGENRARPGPDLGDVPTGQIAADGCHPNEEGRRSLGARLLDFGF